MDINRFLEELDRLFEEKNINDVEPFLRISMDKATEEEDKSAQFTILNEMIFQTLNSPFSRRASNALVL